jgi:hypothetical protein
MLAQNKSIDVSEMDTSMFTKTGTVGETAYKKTRPAFDLGTHPPI